MLSNLWDSWVNLTAQYQAFLTLLLLLNFLITYIGSKRLVHTINEKVNISENIIIVLSGTPQSSIGKLVAYIILVLKWVLILTISTVLAFFENNLLEQWFPR